MFIAAQFTIARTWKPPRCPLADEWIKKLWYIHIMEYCCTVLHAWLLSRVWYFVTPMDYMADSSVRGILQARILGLPFPSSGNLPSPGIKPVSPASPALAGRFFSHWAIWETPMVEYYPSIKMNEFELVELWWMNLELVNTEWSKKEKQIY